MWGNLEWQHKFKVAEVHHLLRVYSDHDHIMVKLIRDFPSFRIKWSFKFQATWLQHLGFSEFLLEIGRNIKMD